MSSLPGQGFPCELIRLRCLALDVGASMRVQDSLQDGKSRFYAEITRLRQMMDLSAGPTPLLFLLDELLSGTNSHDRRIGATAIVRTLVESGAVGLVTTHDLALAEIVDHVAPHALNVHFEDHVEDGRISFDYQDATGSRPKKQRARADAERRTAALTSLTISLPGNIVDKHHIHPR